MSEETQLNNTQTSEIVRNYLREEKAMRERVLQGEEWRLQCESRNFLKYVPFQEPCLDGLGDSVATYDADIKDEVERIRKIVGK